MIGKPVSDLESHLGYWLRLVSNAVSHGFARRLAAEDITVAEWVFMRKLYDIETLQPSRLAVEMRMTKGAISKLVDRLVIKGLVFRSADPVDGRSQVIGLTAEGRARVPAMAALADENDAEYFGVLEPEDRSLLERVLKLVVARQGLDSVPTD